MSTAHVEPTPVNAAQQVEYETGARPRYAIFAAVAGVLVFASAIVGVLGPQSKVSETTLALIYAHKRAGFDIGGAAINLLGLIAEAVTLNWLWQIAHARDQTLRPIVRYLAVGGALLLGIALFFYTVLNVIKGGQFVSSGLQTYPEAHRLTSGALFAVPVLLADLGAFALTIGLIWVSLVAMRVGLLPRFLGYVGVFAGILILFPFVQLPVVQVYWLIALAALFAGRWPSGVPAAWTQGVAVPWAPSGQARSRSAGAARPPRQPRPARDPRQPRLSTRDAIMAAVKGGGRSAPTQAAAPEPLDAPADTARTRANTSKRKRKRRK
jgi:hypothetical protein